MSYLVLARKYRPQRFDEVVGQEHITRTLANAITAGRLAHAILFAGPRGTGKTTVARILAKCVNCAAGPTTEPCNQCQSCREITGSHATDVFEIDGASNNKVENVRELRENARYMPAHSPYKIYIVDEVHMLSDAAFNALLKILEEPPAHVMFFFATTEPNKIPITILSRCQRHDFKRVAIDPLIEHMSGLCEKEAIPIKTEGLALVAREADGSVRDGLSLLDHIMACASGPVDTPEILDVLGGIDRRDLFAISEAVFKGDTAAVLEVIDRCYSRGQHMMKLFTEIVAHFRNLLVVQMGGEKDTLADVPAHEIEALKQQTAAVPATYLNQVLDMLFREESLIKHSGQPKIALEMAFLRILQIKPALPLDTLIEKLDLLRSEVARQGGTAANAESGAPAKTGIGHTDSGHAIGASADVTGHAPSASGQAQEPPTAPDDPVSPPAPSAPDLTEAAPAAQPETEPEVQPEARAPQTDEEHWQCIMARLSDQQPSLAACLAESRMKSVRDGKIEIELPASQFHANWIQRDKSRELLKQLCCEQFGRPDMALCLTSPQTAPEETAKTDKQEAERLKQEALNHPMVETAMKLFQGRIVDVKIL